MFKNTKNAVTSQELQENLEESREIWKTDRKKRAQKKIKSKAQAISIALSESRKINKKKKVGHRKGGLFFCSNPLYF